MSNYTALTAVTVIAALASRTAAADPTPPVAVAHVLIIRLAPEGEEPAADARLAVQEDYVATQRHIIQSQLIAERAFHSTRLQNVPAVGVDTAAIRKALKVEPAANGLKHSLTITATGVKPEVGVVILEAVLDGYQDFLQQTFKLPERGQRFRGGYAVAVLAKPAPVRK